MKEVSQVQIDSFAALFAGLTRAYGLGHGECKHYSLVLAHYRMHLLGTMSLGVYPLTDDGTVRWAAVDIDTGRSEDCVAVYHAIRNLGIEHGVVPFTSRRKGYHVITFFDGRSIATDVRRILLAALFCAQVSPATERFPKQDFITSPQVGNYLNLPYYGDAEPGRRVAIHPRTLEPLSLETFLSNVRPFPAVRVPEIATGLPELPPEWQQGGSSGNSKSDQELVSMFTHIYGESERRVPTGLPALVGVLRGRALPEDAAVALLVPWAREHFRPALDDKTVEKHIRDMYQRYGEVMPRLHRSTPIQVEVRL